MRNLSAVTGSRPGEPQEDGTSWKSWLKTVAEKTGLPLDKAQGAIDAVMDFLKDKLPEPIAGQIEKLIEGGGNAMGGITDKLGDMTGGLTDKLGGMFGKKD